MKGRVSGKEVLVAGILKDSDEVKLHDQKHLPEFDETPSETPITGIAIPLEDKCVDECIILPSLDSLSETFKSKIRHECARVSESVLVM